MVPPSLFSPFTGKHGSSSTALIVFFLVMLVSFFSYPGTLLMYNLPPFYPLWHLGLVVNYFCEWLAQCKLFAAKKAKAPFPLRLQSLCNSGVFQYTEV